MSIRSIILFSCILLFSCKQEKTINKISVDKVSLTNIWRLTEIGITDDFYHASNSLEQRKIQGQIGQGYILSFFPNGEMTRLIDNDMSVYQWRFVESGAKGSPSLIIENEFEKDTFTNVVLEENKGFVFLKCEYRNIGTYKFHKEHEMLADYKQDPYFSKNNSWRIASEVYESEKQLKFRIVNYLNHYKLLLSSSSQRPNSKIRLKNSEGILRVFDGGVGLKQRGQIPKKWLHTFYSDSQAYDVYDRLEKHFKKRTIKKKTNAGWRVDNTTIIDSLIGVY